MLDLRQMLPDFELLARETIALEKVRQRQLDTALKIVNLDDAEWQSRLDRIKSAKTEWLSARPFGDRSIVNSLVNAPACPVPYSALACDGSQIPFDRHEIAPCYLLNIGRIALHYGTGERPFMDSVAKLFYSGEHVLGSNRDERGMDGLQVSEDEIADRRFSMEINALAELAENCSGKPDVAGLVDGTLILWHKSGGPGQKRALKQKVDDYVRAADRATVAGVPIVGYLSRPASREVVGSLRIWLKHDIDPNVSRTSPLDHLTDADVFSRTLQPGQRSGLFRSESRVLKEYSDAQKIVFCYLNAGGEIARLEMPSWVASDDALVERVHAIVMDQVKKGAGYPVSLSEAHEQANVRAPERELFFRMVEQAMAKVHLPALRTAKALAKRRRSI